MDDEPLDVSKADIVRFTRTLDMQAGVLIRELEWRTPLGKRLSLKTTRLVSFTHRHLIAIDYELTFLDSPAGVDISSELVNRQSAEEESVDPRKPPLFRHKVLTSEYSYCRRSPVCAVLSHPVVEPLAVLRDGS